MSDLSGGRRRYERIEWEVPLPANHTTGSDGHIHAGARAIYGLIGHMEDEATKHNIDTNCDDWFHVDAYEDEKLVFWFELPDATKWVP